MRSFLVRVYFSSRRRGRGGVKGAEEGGDICLVRGTCVCVRAREVVRFGGTESVAGKVAITFPILRHCVVLLWPARSGDSSWRLREGADRWYNPPLSLFVGGWERC